jgi:hypothetical protein
VPDDGDESGGVVVVEASDGDVLGAVVGGHVGLGEFAVGSEADLESFGLAGSAFGLGLGDAGEEVVADLFQAPRWSGKSWGAGT